ncbi:MAG: PA2169 family four-helix-bundle protein [Rhodoferax sp.]|nr:PA2169 family four-helix-bundle protein [Rhodoferax sp.]
MRTVEIEALHDLRTATNDVLEGYREMSERAEPEIQSVIQRLTGMHERHALELDAELLRLRDASLDDSSFQGTVNKVVVILRDWVSDIGHDVLPAVRQGEDSLRNQYKKSLGSLQGSGQTSVVELLTTQCESIGAEILRLPNS